MRVRGLALATGLALAVCLAADSTCQAQSASDLLGRGTELLARNDLVAAGECFERARAQAVREGDSRAEAGAHRGLGSILLRKADYASARREFELALSLFEAAGDRLNAAHVLGDQAHVAWSLRETDKAVRLYREALGHFEALGERRGQAVTLYNLAFTLAPGDEQRGFLERGLELARELGDKRLEGLLLHRRGDQQFVEGDAAGANASLERAAALLREVDAEPQLARALTSLGRLYRFHGQPRRAIEFYEQGLTLQRRIGDRHGIVQSTDAIAIACQEAGDRECARRQYEQALELARAGQAPVSVARQLAHLGAFLVEAGEFAAAIERLEEAVRLNSKPVSGDYTFLTRAYLGASRPHEALAAADRAVALASSEPVAAPTAAREALFARALVRSALGQKEGALADARDALAGIETLRSGLVGSDYMRREFLERHRRHFAFLVGLLHAAGLHAEALEVAERGRARAFLDLLATRQLGKGLPGNAAADEPKTAHAAGSPPPPAALPLRGAAPSGSRTAATAAEESAPDLLALASARPFSAADIAAAAARLRSTVLSYWVGPDATYAWVTTPSGALHSARIEITAERLQALVAGGETAGTAAARVTSGRARRATSAGSDIRVATRGGSEVFLEGVAQTDWRRLYDLLVQPVLRWLPARKDGRLLIVPHGPLLRLSFAALQDPQGHYLLERFTLHYVPAAALLDLAGKKDAAGGRPRGYLLVADPAALPPGPDGHQLQPLPGTRQEVAAIARQARAAEVHVLAGADATEQAVILHAAGKRVVHFATHGVVDDERPFESFLALGQKGRLTAGEIYGLDLSADLVVLSACRTALGGQSGDGIIGLTRAFFYAGTASVVATLWDVADEPTSLLVSHFYRALLRGSDKASALRSAQLDVLEALRSGQVKATTPLGVVTLPENPLFWAGFVLQGRS